METTKTSAFTALCSMFVFGGDLRPRDPSVLVCVCVLFCGSTGFVTAQGNDRGITDSQYAGASFFPSVWGHLNSVQYFPEKIP